MSAGTANSTYDVWPKLFPAATGIAHRFQPVEFVVWANCWLLFSVSYWWQTRLITLIAIGILLVRPRLRHAGTFWIGVAIAWLPQLILDWQRNEDHVYLAIYWVAATGLALLGNRKSETLAFNARVLIGLCFLSAAIWKTASPEFTSGQVLGFKMVEDFRFREMLTVPVMGMTQEAAGDFESSYSSLRSPLSNVNSIAVDIPAGLIGYSAFMTWWTIAIEWTIAILFLWPRRFRFEWIRDLAMIFFVVATYLIVPVMGFANVFCIMGYAQVANSHWRWRSAYLLLLIVANLWHFWRPAILTMVGAG